MNHKSLAKAFFLIICLSLAFVSVSAATGQAAVNYDATCKSAATRDGTCIPKKVSGIDQKKWNSLLNNSSTLSQVQKLFTSASLATITYGQTRNELALIHNARVAAYSPFQTALNFLDGSSPDNLKCYRNSSLILINDLSNSDKNLPWFTTFMLGLGAIELANLVNASNVNQLILNSSDYALQKSAGLPIDKIAKLSNLVGTVSHANEFFTQTAANCMPH